MSVLDIIKLILFGVIEGVTEWIPVSNTGHLAVASHFLDFSVYRESMEFREMFVGSAMFGSAMAALLLFVPGNFLFIRTFRGARKVSRDRSLFWLIAIVSFLPTLLALLLFGTDLTEFVFAVDSLRNQRLTVVIMIIGAAVTIFAELRNRTVAWLYERPNEIPPRYLLLAGCAQIVLFLPGASRFGVILLVLMALGAKRSAAVSTAVFLSIPSMLTTSLLWMLRSIGSVTGMQISAMITVMIVAFFVSFYMLRMFVRILSNSEMIRFAKYRAAFGILLLLFFIL
ncbi:MAG: hypothetical protein IKX54_02930 [Lachnospiraceae bacterium]|nr:hypothetical protein [Lachnospiraceae bacterium]